MDDGPRAVVVPLGVPDEARGLGLGLAALIHMHARVGGASVALARLEAKKVGDEDAPTTTVEVFLTPAAWRDVQDAAEPPRSVQVIVTGSLDPPSGARGAVHLLAFDARDHTVRASLEAVFDEEHAGDVVARALIDLAGRIDGEPGPLADLCGLSWEALESVLLAERCALLDVARGAPYDRMAALVHLGRAVGDAPDAPYPARRLAALALDSALAPDGGPRMVQAARRALERAISDAPAQPDLRESMCVLCMRTGDAPAAEERARALSEAEPARTRTWAVLSEALRARGDHDGALAAIDGGLRHAPGDLGLCVERGIVLAERGELDEACIVWREVMLRHPLHAGAFVNLAQLAAAQGDARMAHELCDTALAALGVAHAHPEVFRRAIELALGSEPEGLPRASRVAALARALLARAPDDAHATGMLAHALATMGDRERAAALFEEVRAKARGTTLAAEAQRGLFALRDPATATELDAALRAAMTAEERELDAVAARARHLAMAHGQWLAYFALGVAEKRRARWSAARDAFSAALELAPGCTPVLTELAEAERNAAVAGRGPVARLRESLARLRR